MILTEPHTNQVYMGSIEKRNQITPAYIIMTLF